uniref:Leucine-rich PPR motif-containing protein, mitochondrial n=1 Tax=Wuchereria bancrofti TaxID=6293 RepID=A0AAF5RVH9_WUCBA
MFIAASSRATKSLCRKRITESIGKRTTSTNQDIAKTVGPPILITNSLGSYDSKWPLDSLDKSQHTQMSYLGLSLLKKHVKHFQVDQQKNIYDVIDSIEWNYVVTEAHLEKALHILNDPKCSVKKLMDSEITILISATGCRCQMLSAAQRNEYTIRLLNILKIRGVMLGITARNALLAVQIDNQVDVDVVKTLKQFESDGLVPDAQTYGQLSRIYARKADLKGIFEIINHIRNIGVKLPDLVLESMVYSLTSSGEDEKAKSIIENVANNIFLADGLKMAYTLAKAEYFGGENALEFLDKIVDVDTFVEKHQISIYELLFSLAKKGNLEAVVKLRNLLPSLSEDVDSQWGYMVYSKVRTFLSKKEENIAAAALLLDFIPNTEKRLKLRSILTRLFPSSIQKKHVADAISLCTIFQKCNILKHPFRIYLNSAALNNPKDFHDLFTIYKGRDDFAGLYNRPHLQLPVAVLHFKELMKTDIVEKKVEHLLEIARSLQSTGIASCGDKYFANVKDLFILPLLKDMNALLQLMKKIENENSLQRFVVDVLITHLLATKQMQQLQLLLHGALKNSSAGDAYPYREVKSLILNTSIYNKNLISACCLLRLLFPLPGVSSNRQYGKGMQIIKAAIVAGDLNKVKVMCELWSADKRIVLRKIDKDDLLQTLDRKGELSKKQFVTKLSEKLKPHVTTSYGIRQKPVAKTENGSRKRIEAELQNALDCGDLERAEKIWAIGLQHVSPSIGLLLAEKLYFSKMMNQFKSVLMRLNELHEDLSYHVLTAYDSSDASDTRMVFLNETSKILDLHLNIKQELLYNTRVNAFHELIEKGDLSQALDLLKIISAQKNSVFGQFDLMGAAIERDDTMIISEVLNLITTYHGKESSLADFCIALLERCKKTHAMRLVQTSSFRLSSAKLNYYIDREIDLDRIEVILDLFELCIPKGNLEQRDLENAMSKIVTFFVKRKNKAMINLIEERLKGIGKGLTPEMNSLLLKLKEQDFGIINNENVPTHNLISNVRDFK